MSKVWKGCLIVLATLILFGVAGVFFLLSMRGFHLPMIEMPLANRHGIMPAGQALGWVSILRISLPVLVISLLVLLGIWIGKNSRTTINQNINTAPEPQPEPVCAACGRVLDAEWLVCPYCGNHR